MNTGSTYALASAMSIDPRAVLGWLDAFDYVSGLNNTYGFYDAGRSATEIAHEYIGIDVASAILGLGGNGPKDFETYLKNSGLETAYNLLYDSASKRLQNITQTTAGFPNAPMIPDRSFSVFNNLSELDREGTIAFFPPVYVTGATGIYGAQFRDGALAGGWGGHYWNLDQVYDARSNQFVIHYTTADTPQQIKVEFKDGGGQAYTTILTLPVGVRFGRLAIDLPDQAVLSAVSQITLVVDQNVTGDTGFDFTIHSMMFQHFPSAPASKEMTAVSGLETAAGVSGAGEIETSRQSLVSASGITSPVIALQSAVIPESLVPDLALGSSNVTSLPGNGTAQIISSSPDAKIQRVGKNVFQIGFDLRNATGFSEMYVNFDPDKKGNSIDLFNVPELVFGVNSDKAKTVKLSIKDKRGRKASYYLKNIDTNRNYYRYLTSLSSQSIDLGHVGGLSLSVGGDPVLSVAGHSGSEAGSFQVEIGGLS